MIMKLRILTIEITQAVATTRLPIDMNPGEVRNG
jgi:hypothetical protein